MRTEATAGGAGAPGARADVDQLRDEVAGLHRAMESRGLIEQAKGVLMQRHGWTPDHAFRHLVQLSQHLNVRLAAVAETVVADAASARGVEPTDEAFAYRLLDLLGHPAMTVRPVSSTSELDFAVEYANPATVDIEGRTAEQLVGRRLSKLYTGAPASAIVAACTHAWRTASRAQLSPAQTVDRAAGHNGPLARLQAVPFLGRLLVTW